MRITLLAAIAVFASLAAGPAKTYAAEGDAPTPGVVLPPDLLDLLRAEMRELTGGVQDVVLSLATADWKEIQEASEKMRASYIMEKKLTPAQAGELERALPERFKQLDAEFHQRAQRLGEAAAAHDAELVVFHYSRLVESCVRCHSEFARQRFTGFASPVPPAHHR